MARHKIELKHAGPRDERDTAGLSAEPPSAASPVNPATIDEADREILGSVERYLKDGLTLKAWYEKASSDGTFAQRFDLARTENRPDQGFGFFDAIEIQGETKPVMGNYQEMFYDQPGAISAFDDRQTLAWRKQVREFVLHYFMRVSSFSEPTAHIDSGYPDPSGYLAGLSWCQPAARQQQGFGFSQLYCKSRDTGEILKFPAHERHAIVDLREVVKRYEWVILRVEIFDFELKVEPLGQGGPGVVLNLAEASYLVLAPEFVIDRETPGEAIRGRYGFGYAFIRNPKPGINAYGAGEFDAAFESIEFDVAATGKITVRIAFVSNRPEQVTNMKVNPLQWAYSLANTASLGLAERLLPGVKDALPTFGLGNFDPVNAYISLANTLTAGQAADMLCISRDQLDKRFLLQHFTQHYQTMVGSLMTWRQIPDWLDAKSLPLWVVTGGLIDG
ncbi:MAG: hypothetical protein ABSH31_03080 [Bryobacteraceae bacterium]|jgi:hypothetical protein